MPIALVLLAILCQTQLLVAQEETPDEQEIAPHAGDRVAPPLERGEYRGAGIKLHRPDGSEIFANPRAIAFVRLPLEGETGNSVVVFANGGKQSIKESVPQVIDLIAAERYIISPVPKQHP
jgi:hypothetical protein